MSQTHVVLVEDDKELRESLIEYVAETDDDLLEQFLEEGELTDEEVATGLAKAVQSAQITPVCTCASLSNKGTSVILDAIVDMLPYPEQRSVIEVINPNNEDF